MMLSNQYLLVFLWDSTSTVFLSNEKIKIETDNGCEIKFPAHLFNDATAGIVIKKASDRVTITISGISEYKLK